jgi:uncharacterized protein (TIGR02246 family)
MPRTSQEQRNSDETALRSLIENWAKAVRDRDLAAIRADHDQHMLMFDVPPPTVLHGLDAYMASWDAFFSWSERPVAFDIRDVEITAGGDVAFATALGRCAGVDQHGKREALEFRLTIGFRKIDGQWRITHEHHSLPAA